MLFDVMTFNVRCDMECDGDNQWKYRRGESVQTILENAPVLMGTQEILNPVLEQLRPALPGYGVAGVTREPENPRTEGSYIFYDRSRAELLDSHDFWLSPTPEVCASHFDGVMVRMCTMGEFLLKESGKRLRFFNAHTDHLSALAQEKGVDIIVDYMEKYQKKEKLPIIFTGDLNVNPSALPIQKLLNNAYVSQGITLYSAYAAAGSVTHPGNSYHGWTGEFDPKGEPIDYIFTSEEIRVKSVKIDTRRRNGRLPSDHFPVSATLEL